MCDCPADGCTDARVVYHPQTSARQTEDVCAVGHPFRIEMPPPQLEAQIVAAVAGRAKDADKAWYPDGHTRATLAGLPTGQTVEQLLDENGEVEAFRAAQADNKRQQMQKLLAGLGIEVRPDGTFEGSL